MADGLNMQQAGAALGVIASLMVVAEPVRHTENGVSLWLLPQN